jgi:hypothetical protein
MMRWLACTLGAVFGLALFATLPGAAGTASAAAPASVVAAVRSAAAKEGLPIVSLQRSPSLRVVVRLDRPVAQLRRGSLFQLIRAVAPLQGKRWDVVAVDRRGAKIRESRGFGNGGSAYIRPGLDGCDPSFVPVGRPVMPMFGSDPLCAGDAPAPAGHPVDVGGAQPGVAFPLTVAVSGQRLYALVNDQHYESSRGFYSASPVGSATLRSAGQLVFTVAGTTVVLRRS